MLRYLLSSRAILAGLVFFVVIVVSGSLLYSWHVKRTTAAEWARHTAFLQSLKNKSEARTAQDTVETNTTDFQQAETPLVETDDVQMADSTEGAPTDEASDMLNVADAFLPDDFVEEPVEEGPVSPFGFGPYPEVPADYPSSMPIPWQWSEEFIAGLEKAIEKSLQVRGVSFTEHLKINELMTRVGIKLWNEGHRSFMGMTSSDRTGLIYPMERDVLYVAWDEVVDRNGEVRRYMSQTLGPAISGLSIAAQEGREPLPDWIDIRSYEEGINPYDFLGLDR